MPATDATGDSSLSPFVVTLRDRVLAAASDLLGIPESLARLHSVTYARPEAGTPWSLVVQWQPESLPAMHVEIAEGVPGARAWFRGTRVTLSYWPLADGRDPLAVGETKGLLAYVRSRVEAVDRARESPPLLAALVAALADTARFDGVEDRFYRYNEPHEALIRLGFRCNQKCDFCWQARDWPDAPDAMYTRWLDELAAQGVDTVHFSGGEPTIHPQLPALVDRASRTHGMSVWIQTNAIRLAREPFAGDLVRAGLTGIFASFHSHDAAISDAMTVAPGTHAVTERGIANALGHGVRVILNTLVERRNAAQLGAYARHVVERFVRPFPGNPVQQVMLSQPGTYRSEANYEQALMPLDALRGPLTDAVRTLQAAGVVVQTGGGCGFPVCVFTDAPDLADMIAADEATTELARDRVFVDACRACAAQPYCIGLRARYVSQYGDRGVVPFDTLPPRLVGHALAPAPRTTRSLPVIA